MAPLGGIAGNSQFTFWNSLSKHNAFEEGISVFLQDLEPVLCGGFSGTALPAC
jgi:hypothetical protein